MTDVPVVDFSDTAPVRPAESDSTVETPPRRRGRQPGTRNKPKLIPGSAKLSATQQKQVQTGLTFAVMGMDFGAAAILPKFWETPADRLQQDEVALLVSALYSELESFPRALLWLASVAEAGVHFQLAYVVAMIAAPRLARHGVISAELAGLIALAPLAVSVPVAGGGTPDSVRTNGTGEVASVVSFTGAETLQNSVPFQGGPGEVGNAENNPRGGRSQRRAV